jgi:hypothetical protein
MIYTIGHKQSYLKAIANSPDGTILKSGKQVPCKMNLNEYEGGCAFRSIKDAQRRINEEYPTSDYVVFGLKADWGKDTEKNQNGGWWHNLLKDSEIVVLAER